MYGWDWGRPESSSVSLCVSCSAVSVRGVPLAVAVVLSSYTEMLRVAFRSNNSWVTWKGLHVSFKGSM